MFLLVSLVTQSLFVQDQVQTAFEYFQGLLRFPDEAMPLLGHACCLLVCFILGQNLLFLFVTLASCPFMDTTENRPRPHSPYTHSYQCSYRPHFIRLSKEILWETMLKTSLEV